MSSETRSPPERLLPALTRRAFMVASALSGAALALSGCAVRPRRAGEDGGPFFDDNTGFVA